MAHRHIFGGFSLIEILADLTVFRWRPTPSVRVDLVGRCQAPIWAPRWTRPRRRERGYLLLIALFVLIITMAMSSALAAALMLRMERLERQQANLQLTALLDAALSHSLAELSDHPGWRGTGGEIPFGDGTYAADAEWLGNSRVEVRLSASYGRYGRAAEAEIDTYLKQVVRWEPLAFDLESPDGIPRDDEEGRWGD